MVAGTVDHKAVDSALGDLVLKIRGSSRNGQLLRLKSSKCTIGSNPNCTLRLRARGVEPVHCLILRGKNASVIRRWSPDTRLNGRSFTDAQLAVGDRLSIGSFEFEIVSVGEVQVQDPNSSLHQADQRSQSSSQTVSWKDYKLESEQLDIREKKILKESEDLEAREKKILNDSERLKTLEQKILNESQQLESREKQFLKESEELKKRENQILKESAELKNRENQVLKDSEQVEIHRQQALKDQESLNLKTKQLEESLTALQAKQNQFEEERNRWNTIRNAKLADESKRQAGDLENQRLSLNTQQVQLDSQRSELDNSRKQIEVKQSELNNQLKQLEVKRNELEVQRNLLESELEEQRSELESQRQSLAIRQQEQQADLNNLKEQIQERDRLLSKQAAELEKQSEEIKQQSLDIQKKTADLQTQSGRLELLQSEFETKRGRWECALQEREKNLCAKEEEISKSNGELESLQTQIQTERQDMERRLAEIDAEREQWETERNRLESLLEAAKSVEATEESRSAQQSQHAPVSVENILSHLGQNLENAEEEQSDVEEPSSVSAGNTRHECRKVEEPVADQHAEGSATHDEEESVEAYMARLMQRIRSTQTDIDNEEENTKAPAAGDKEKSDSPNDSMVFPQPIATHQPSKISDPSELSPRTQAPETQMGLGTLRDLANYSAQSALGTHARQKMIHAMYAKFIVSAFSGLAGLGMLFVWKMWCTGMVTFYAAMACFVVTVAWGIQYVMLTLRLLANAPGSDIPKLSPQSADEAGNDSDSADANGSNLLAEFSGKEFPANSSSATEALKALQSGDSSENFHYYKNS